MKKYLVILLSVLTLAVSLRAETVVKDIGATQMTNVLSGGSQSTQFIVNNATITNTILMVWDTPFSTNVLVLANYTNFVLTTTSITNVWTNYFGVINSNVFTAVTNRPVIVSGQTNALPQVVQFLCPSNQTTTFTFPNRFLGGILVSNTAAPVTLTVNYTQ